MTDADAPHSAILTDDARLTPADRRTFFRLVGIDRWTAPILVMLGLASSFAESLGIGLVVLFLYTAIGDDVGAAPADGALGVLLASARGVFGEGYGLAAAILALIVLRALLRLSYSLIVAAVRGRFSQRIRDGVHRQYLDVDYEFIRRHEQGDLLNVLSIASWSVAEAFLRLTRIIINLCTIVVFAGFMVAMSWHLFLVAAIGSVCLFAMLRLLSGQARQLGWEANDNNRRLAERMLATLQGMRVIRAFAQEDVDHRNYRSVSTASRRTLFAMERLYAAIAPLMEVGYLALLAGLLAFSDMMDISFATTLTVVALLYRLQPHVRELESNLLSLAEMEAPVAKVIHMLDRSDKRYRAPGAAPFVRPTSKITFEKVSFRFAHSRSCALDQASFHVPAGRVTAIVGPSGSGKSTVVNLLLRLYEPTAGRILVDGTPLDSIRAKAWLSHVAACGQDVDLMDGTVMENIRMAAPDAPDALFEKAVQAAGVAQLVDALPDGYNSWIGQRGANLSGGQRQRIGVARALLRDPDVLILDEATTALDEALELQVGDAVRRFMAGRTLVVITHRMERALQADHLVCLKNGLILIEGPPQAVAPRLQLLQAG